MTDDAMNIVKAESRVCLGTLAVDGEWVDTFQRGRINEALIVDAHLVAQFGDDADDAQGRIVRTPSPDINRRLEREWARAWELLGRSAMVS